MAGSSMTFSYQDIGNIRKVTAEWTSDDSTGAVSGTSNLIVGELIKAVTIPDGSAAPSDNYDIAITDDDSVDVLGQSHDDLADRDTANTEEVYFALNLSTTVIGAFPVVASPLTFAVTNAGNSKQGTIELYYRYELP